VKIGGKGRTIDDHRTGQTLFLGRLLFHDGGKKIRVRTEKEKASYPLNNLVMKGDRRYDKGEEGSRTLKSLTSPKPKRRNVFWIERVKDR